MLACSMILLEALHRWLH